MANRQERRKAAVFTPVMVPASAIEGHCCAWRDCSASFKGDLPGGWRWVISHSLPAAELNLMTPAALDHLDLDVVLCPQHVTELQAHLVEMPAPQNANVTPSRA
jgi:hypothetical protein